MTKEQAIEWYKQIQSGQGVNRSKYLKEFDIGRVAERLWNDGIFTLGVEYGALIAIVTIFGLTEEDVS